MLRTAIHFTRKHARQRSVRCEPRFAANRNNEFHFDKAGDIL